MNRTRLTFFAILGALLVMIAASLLLQLVDGAAILPLYVAATIFAIGIVALDFLGILGDDNTDDAGDLSAAIDADVDASAVDIAGTDFEAGDTSEGDTNGHIHDLAGYDVNYRRAGLVISLLSYLRLTVYFCLGFGPAGWAALSSGRSALASLGLAATMGVAALFLAMAFFRFQRRDTDSSLKQVELLQAPATVTIPLTHNTMGKVRIQIGMNVAEHYALAMRPDAEYKTGDRVHILRVTDECVYVA